MYVVLCLATRKQTNLFSVNNEVWGRTENLYILLDVLLCSIAEYFYELCCILTSP